MENRLIQVSDVMIGDEIIISAHRQLKYLKVLTVPKKVDSTTFKVSLRRDMAGTVDWSWSVNNFEQDVTKHNNVMYQNLYGRDIFLIKRETI